MTAPEPKNRSTSNCGVASGEPSKLWARQTNDRELGALDGPAMLLQLKGLLAWFPAAWSRGVVGGRGYRSGSASGKSRKSANSWVKVNNVSEVSYYKQWAGNRLPAPKGEGHSLPGERW